LQSVTNFGDEATIAGQNILLTFTQIGRDVFPQATQTMLDMSTAMDQGLKETAIQLGKALNDPIQGVTALRRVGVQLTEEQERQIQTFMEAGEVAEAQRVILAELEKEFGGSAEAAREADAGFQAAKNSLGDLGEVIGGQMLPGLQALNERVVASANGWAHLIQQLGALSDKNAAVAAELGMTASELTEAQRNGVISSDEIEAALERVNSRMTQQETAATRAAAGTRMLARFAREAANAEAALGAQMARANDASAARYQGLANAYRTNPVLVEQEKQLEETRIQSVEAKEQAKEQAQAFTSAYSSAANEMASKISSAVSTAASRLKQVWPGANEIFGEQQDPGEFSRRLAALAKQGSAGLDQVWAEQFKQQAGGNPIYAGLLQSLEAGDSAAVAAQANELLSTNMAQVLATGLKENLRAQLQQEQILQEAQRIVAEELGRTPASQTMDIVTQAAGTSTEAQGQVTDAMVTMGDAAESASDKIVTAQGKALKLTQELNIELAKSAGLFEAAGDAAKRMGDQAANNGFYSQQTDKVGTQSQLGPPPNQ